MNRIIMWECKLISQNIIITQCSKKTQLTEFRLSTSFTISIRRNIIIRTTKLIKQSCNDE